MEDLTAIAFRDSLSSAFSRAFADFEDVRRRVQSVAGYVTEGAAGFQPLVDTVTGIVIAFSADRDAMDLLGMRRRLGELERLVVNARKAFLGEDGDSTVGLKAAAADAADKAAELAGPFALGFGALVLVVVGVVLFVELRR